MTRLEDQPAVLPVEAPPSGYRAAHTQAARETTPSDTVVVGGTGAGSAGRRPGPHTTARHRLRSHRPPVTIRALSTRMLVVLLVLLAAVMGGCHTLASALTPPPDPAQVEAPPRWVPGAPGGAS